MNNVIYVPLFREACEDEARARQKYIAEFVKQGWVQRGIIELRDNQKRVIPVQILIKEQL